MLINWRSWCRLCAKYDGTCIDLFIKQEYISDLTQFIQKYFNLSIIENDNYPHMICNDCFNLIRKFHKLTEKCTKVDLMFSELLCSESNVKFNENNLQEIRNKFNVNAENFNEDVNMVHEEIVCAIVNADIEENDVKPALDDENDSTYDLFDINAKDKSKMITRKKKSNNAEETNEKKKCETFKKKKIRRKSDAEQKSEDEPKKKERRKKTDEYIPIRCDICMKEFTRKSTLVWHVNFVHGTRELLFGCSQCPKRFTSKKNVKAHEIVHLPPELKLIYPCTYCDKKFSKTSYLQTHTKAVHLQEKPFICEECGKSFSLKQSLKEHIILHSDETPYQCRFCPKKFKNLRTLKAHEDIHSHTMYECPDCGLQLNTKRTLKEHMIVHSDVKNFKCQYCGNEFKRAKALKNHLIVHSGLRPYTCQFCDQTFTNSSNCSSHKRKAHPIEWTAMKEAKARAYGNYFQKDNSVK